MADGSPAPLPYHRVLKLARTIADLDGKPVLGTAHVAEALQYRQRRVLA